MKKVYVSIVLFLSLFFASLTVYNNSNQPPTARSGAPGEQTCASCHGGNNPKPNLSNLLFDFDNGNFEFEAGETYNIDVTVQDAAKSRFGFQSTALTQSNDPAGQFAVLNASNTGLATGFNGREYISHFQASGNNSWTFQWTAPANPDGDITFYVSSVAGAFQGSSNTNVYVDQFTVNFVPPTIPGDTLIADFGISSGGNCLGDTIIFADNSSGDIDGWMWDFGDGASPQTATGKGPHSVVYSNPGSKNVSLTISDSNTGNDTTIVKQDFLSVSELPVLQASSDTIICEDESIDLFVSGADSYLWSPAGSLNNSNSESVVASPQSSTTYLITATNTDGCSADTSISVSVNPKPELFISIAGNDTICKGESASLMVTGALSYEWAASGSTDSSIVVTPESTTTYTVTGTDVNACANTGSITVFVEDCTNLAEVSNLLEVKTYPNPVRNQHFYIELPTDYSSAANMNFYSKEGRLIKQSKLTAGMNRINIPDLPEGIYFLYLSDQNIQKTIRIFIAN